MSSQVKESVIEARARLQGHFAEFSGDKYGQGWENLWAKGDFLPWDKGAPNPALIDTLQEQQNIIGNAMVEVDGKLRRKRALVPGCGRGVDVLLLKSFGYDAIGLEYSETAVKACRKYEEEHGSEYQTYDEMLGEGSAQFVVGDFFQDDWLAGIGGSEKRFDLIYDYTFFCALNPSFRPNWAKRMSQLLGPAPHSNLFCLEFPTYKPLSTGGPPFGSSPEAYMAHLSHPGQQIPYDEHGHVQTGGPDEATEDALVRVAHWHPERTHVVGKDENGIVRDFVAIWRHR
ncbi:hypothetical protein EPUS_05318 [Endocarpon pusillum Z07020]|uniref:Thiol methyltransferase n=1 Tax=Endocarpon pusillum (strain Z07020 / HMAS-L-300199) TaxID=1263415 RepID=U1GHI6_ENDPU|nr:uncharacterized protein EPUS_05318 [Endocarpon pusillum Z07020]ERF71266.1 hypothetical protein EPUS_05318 [Endocarpon pusillum Z07020]